MRMYSVVLCDVAHDESLLNNVVVDVRLRLRFSFLYKVGMDISLLLLLSRDQQENVFVGNSDKQKAHRQSVIVKI